MELTRLKVVGAAQGFNWLPVFVAIEQGYLRDAAIEIELLKVGGVDKATRAVLQGDAPIGITPPEGAVADHVGGGALCIFGANSTRLPMSLVARPGLTDIADLRGKRIGTSSLTEGTALYTQVMLAAEGLQYPRDYGFVLAGIHTARWEALQRGDIDAAPQPAPWSFLAEEQGYPLLGEVSSAIPEILFGALVARRDWLEHNGPLVSRWLLALNQAHRFVNDPANAVECTAIFQQITLKDHPALAARAFVYMRDLGMWPERLELSTRALDTTLDLMVRAGVLEASRREQARSVFEPRYLREALA